LKCNCYAGNPGEVRQQGNDISSFIDLGLVYGNSEAHLNAIREFSGKNII